jgi:hypothetical protein
MHELFTNLKLFAMRKLFLSVALICAAVFNSSCADDLEAQEIVVTEKVETRQSESTIFLTEIQQGALNKIYDFCVEFYGKELGEAAYLFERPTNEEKIAVIRFSDYCCDNGDTICEIPDYDEIREILWPNGYGEF